MRPTRTNARPIAAVLAGLLAACRGADPPAAEPAAPLEVRPAAAACAVGERLRLTATPARGARYDFVASGDFVRVTPEPAGDAAAVACAAVGSGAVTVADARRSVDVPVTVAAAPGAVLGVDVQPAAVTLVTGAEWRLAARALVRDTMVSTGVRFATLDTTVAVVDATGLVHAVAPGATTIVARAAADPAVEARVAVTVERGVALVQSLVIEPPVAFLAIGDSVRLKGTVGPAPGAPAGMSREVVFTTVDTAVATVTLSGLVRGRRPGIARIIASPLVAPAFRSLAFVAVREPVLP